MSELKPCPFCGGDAAISGNGMYVYCKDCGCKSPYVTTGPRFVIAAWNRRAQPAAPAYVEGVNIDRLKESLSFLGAAYDSDEMLAARMAEHINRLTQCVMASKVLLADAAPSVAPEPVAWTLQSELDAAETTCSAHLWFTNPRNSAWTALFTREQIAAHPPRAPLSLSDISDISSLAQIAFCLNKQPSFDVALVREVESAHGIRGQG